MIAGRSSMALAHHSQVSHIRQDRCGARRGIDQRDLREEISGDQIAAYPAKLTAKSV